MADSVTALSHYLIRQFGSLDKAEYEIVRNSILKNLLAYGAMTSDQLGSMVKNHLKHKLHGSFESFYETVRRDLEARGEIRVDRNTDIELIEIVA